MSMNKLLNTNTEAPAPALTQADSAPARTEVRDWVRPMMRCKECGEKGRMGVWPFSTNPSSGLCDDCC